MGGNYMVWHAFTAPCNCCDFLQWARAGRAAKAGGGAGGLTQAGVPQLPSQMQRALADLLDEDDAGGVDVSVDNLCNYPCCCRALGLFRCC